ncbi:hypothetical protein CVIRNUC_007697 [Coccomyxa viridis]|uniref:Nucleotide-diphospho-sugar transferase domain-containing protein n=1 Tax=Coccomyxa viridis TaxID=1274662 RepID=A0AAV1IB96_9CHLO|nr:hypothetical protein CVIRNUC_007697 [Coccomyxa viridis]
MVTWANLHYLDFVLNWVDHVRACGIKAFLVGAMDDRILQELVKRRISTFAMHSGLSEDDFGWGSPTFHKMGREKIHLIETFTDMGFDILVSDVDTVWLKDPLPYMAKYPEADILTSSDHLRNTTGDDGLEIWPDSASAANIGIMLFRKGAGKLAKAWNKALAEDEQVWDQNAFNDLFRQHIEVNSPSAKLRTFMGYDGTLAIGILPVALFASGHTFFVQRLHERMGLQVYCVHATFQYSGTTGKRHRMRERMLWSVDPPKYYNPPGGLLAFEAQLGNLVNESVITGDGMKLEDYRGHFNLVNAQLTQIRNALAVASMLGRTLVLPDLWCGADRWWAPHQGTIPGSALLLPFRCPADHVLDLGRMSAELPPGQYGPGIGYREYSLLDNPRFHAAHVQPGGNPKLAPPRLAPAIVQVCEPGKGRSCRQPGKLVLPGEVSVSIEAGLKEKELLEALQPLKDERLLMFTDMRQAFGGFSSPRDAERFEERLKEYSSLWCCVDAHPGHVWYDLMWDVVPHTDRHGRQQTGPWKPITGP